MIVFWKSVQLFLSVSIFMEVLILISILLHNPSHVEIMKVCSDILFNIAILLFAVTSSTQSIVNSLESQITNKIK